MKYKLLVVDIDGTLVGRNGVISEEDKNALKSAQRAGMAISLSTGRSLLGAQSIIRQLSLGGYHITFDGALVNQPGTGQEVYVTPLGRDVVREAIEYASDNAIALELFSTEHYFTEGETWSTRAHREYFGIEPTIVEFRGIWRRERIIKGGLVAVSAEEKEKMEKFGDRFRDRLVFSWARTPAYPGVAFINVLALNVSKGKALESLARHLGISLKEVVAIGDGSNDIPLLSSAGLAIAMDNAPEEVKAIADHVTLDVENSGLAVAVERYLE